MLPWLNAQVLHANPATPSRATHLSRRAVNFIESVAILEDEAWNTFVPERLGQCINSTIAIRKLPRGARMNGGVEDSVSMGSRSLRLEDG